MEKQTTSLPRGLKPTVKPLKTCGPRWQKLTARTTFCLPKTITLFWSTLELISSKMIKSLSVRVYGQRFINKNTGFLRTFQMMGRKSCIMTEWGFKLLGTQIEGLGGFHRFQQILTISQSFALKILPYLKLPLPIRLGHMSSWAGIQISF
jgi:hypothetical protein